MGDLSLPLTLGGERRETVRDRVPLPRIHVGFRAPVFGDPALDALDLAGQILSGGRGAAQPAARARGADRPGRRPVHPAVHRRCVRVRRLGDGPAGHRRRPGRGGVPRGAGPATTELVSEDELARAKALTEADELGSLQRVEERADRLSMYATLFDGRA